VITSHRYRFCTYIYYWKMVGVGDPERESHAYCLKRETPTPELPPGLCCVCVYTHTHTHTHTLLQDSLLWWGGNSGSCNGIDDTNGSMDDLVQQNSVVTGSGPAPSPEVSVPGQVAKSQLIKLSQRYPPLLGPSPRQMSPQTRLPLIANHTWYFISVEVHNVIFSLCLGSS
jgi:hypothetical protein